MRGSRQIRKGGAPLPFFTINMRDSDTNYEFEQLIKQILANIFLLYCKFEKKVFDNSKIFSFLPYFTQNLQCKREPTGPIQAQGPSPRLEHI